MGVSHTYEYVWDLSPPGLPACLNLVREHLVYCHQSSSIVRIVAKTVPAREIDSLVLNVLVVRRLKDGLPEGALRRRERQDGPAAARG